MARQRRLQDVLNRLVRELDEEDAIDELDDMRRRLDEGHTVTFADIRGAIDGIENDEERAEARRWLRELVADDEPPPPPPPTDDDGGDDEPPPPPPPARRTRPGRRSGNAYDWDVDEDGSVRKLSTAKVYQGADEPDEVELPAELDDDGGAE